MVGVDVEVALLLVVLLLVEVVVGDVEEVVEDVEVKGFHKPTINTFFCFKHRLPAKIFSFMVTTFSFKCYSATRLHNLFGTSMSESKASIHWVKSFPSFLWTHSLGSISTDRYGKIKTISESSHSGRAGTISCRVVGSKAHTVP